MKDQMIADICLLLAVAVLIFIGCNKKPVAVDMTPYTGTVQNLDPIIYTPPSVPSGFGDTYFRDEQGRVFLKFINQNPDIYGNYFHSKDELNQHVDSLLIFSESMRYPNQFWEVDCGYYEAVTIVVKNGNLRAMLTNICERLKSPTTQDDYNGKIRTGDLL